MILPFVSFCEIIFNSIASTIARISPMNRTFFCKTSVKYFSRLSFKSWYEIKGLLIIRWMQWIANNSYSCWYDEVFLNTCNSAETVHKLWRLNWFRDNLIEKFNFIDGGVLIEIFGSKLENCRKTRAMTNIGDLQVSLLFTNSSPRAARPLNHYLCRSTDFGHSYLGSHLSNACLLSDAFFCRGFFFVCKSNFSASC